MVSVRLIAMAGAFAAALSACEMGSDPGGPYKATLTLMDESGTVREFYLGGYGSFEDCAGILSAEVEGMRRNVFWTNPTFDYGGGRRDGWVRHTIIAMSCRREPPLPPESARSDAGRSALGRIVYALGLIWEAIIP